MTVDETNKRRILDINISTSYVLKHKTTLGPQFWVIGGSKTHFYTKIKLSCPLANGLSIFRSLLFLSMLALGMNFLWNRLVECPLLNAIQMFLFQSAHGVWVTNGVVVKPADCVAIQYNYFSAFCSLLLRFLLLLVNEHIKIATTNNCKLSWQAFLCHGIKLKWGQNEAESVNTLYGRYVMICLYS